MSVWCPSRHGTWQRQRKSRPESGFQFKPVGRGSAASNTVSISAIRQQADACVIIAHVLARGLMLHKPLLSKRVAGARVSYRCAAGRLLLYY